MMKINGIEIKNVMISLENKWIIIIYFDKNKQTRTLKIEEKDFEKICNQSFLKALKTKLSKHFESEVN